MFFVFLSFVTCHKYKIKLADTQLYFAKDLKNHRLVKLTDYENGYEFDMIVSLNDSVYKSFEAKTKSSSQGLTWCQSAQNLHYTPFTDNIEQQFITIPVGIYERTYQLMHKGDCVTFDEENMQFNLLSCDPKNPNQLYEFVATDFDYSNLVNADPDLDVVVPVAAPGSGSHDLNKLSVVQHREKENKSMLLSIYKILYDMTICFGNNGTCGITDMVRKGIFQNGNFQSFKSASYQKSFSQKSSSSSSSKSSAIASSKSQSRSF